MATYYNRTTYFKHLTVNFNSHVGIKEPEMTSKERFLQSILATYIQSYTKR